MSVTTPKQAFSPLETMSLDELRAIENTALRKQVRYLHEHSLFYRAKFDQAGIKPDDIRSVEDLAHVPFTEKSELRQSLADGPPLGLHVAAPLDDVVQIQATSGTTGRPSYFGLTWHDCDVWNEIGARAFYAGGFRAHDPIVNAFSMSKGFSGGVPVVKMLQYLGTRVSPIGADAGAERLLQVISDQLVTGITGTPNFIMYVGEQAKPVLGVPATELKVEHLVVGGEPGGGIPAVRRRLEETWGASCSEVLGNSDVSPIMWSECGEKSGMHFVAQGLVAVELIEPETGAIVTPAVGVKAEAVYTALDREASPLLRFRSRDHVEILATECACGRTSYKLRCFGRTDDMLIVRGINVWPTAVSEVVSSFRPKTTGNMRILLDFEGHTTQRHLPVGVEHAADLSAAEVEDVKAQLGQRIQHVLAFRADIQMVPAGTLEIPGAAKVSLVERVAPKGS
jgi:phenylacetate-CoA ligase